MSLVGFENITIFEFPMVLGDNPSCSNGAPVCLGRKHTSSHTHSVDIYEFLRKGNRRSRRRLILDVPTRAEILLSPAGFEMREIVDATLAVQAIRKSRVESLKIQGWQRLTIALETTGTLPMGVMHGVLGTTGQIVSTTGGLLASTGRATGGILITSGRVTGGLLASSGRAITSLPAAVLGSVGSSQRTLQAKSA
jgi:hypothetical protein